MAAIKGRVICNNGRRFDPFDHNNISVLISSVISYHGSSIPPRELSFVSMVTYCTDRHCLEACFINLLWVTREVCLCCCSTYSPFYRGWSLGGNKPLMAVNLSICWHSPRRTSQSYLRIQPKGCFAILLSALFYLVNMQSRCKRGTMET